MVPIFCPVILFIIFLVNNKQWFQIFNHSLRQHEEGYSWYLDHVRLKSLPSKILQAYITHIHDNKQKVFERLASVALH